MPLNQPPESFGQMLGLLASVYRGSKAYLDPGSGSYLLQLLIAGVLGGIIVIRSSWDRIRNFFRNLFSRGEEPPSEDDA
jgi:hypothetical protein